jgi:hypothetical protein
MKAGESFGEYFLNGDLQFPLKIMDDLIHVECKLIEAGNLKVNKI